MQRTLMLTVLFITVSLLFISCTNEKGTHMTFTGAKGEVKLMTLDPGHFHAALIQKVMYDQVSPVVYIYAPVGPDVEDHINRINGYNTRAENPTSWNIIDYRGPDFLEKMIAEKPGNVMVTAGNNKKKTEYIKAAVDAGINVLADKPMCINKTGFELLKEAFVSAAEKDVLLYDIMTERHEITTVLQRELSMIPEVFGELEKGSPENPTVTKESVHHFFKYVSGNPIKRPAWYMDTSQQGEGIVDVTTHLVDLIQWECFPEQIIHYDSEIEMLQANRWPTIMSKAQFEKVTQMSEFPDFLKNKLNEKGELPVYANGDMIYKIKGVHAKVSVIWNFEAPEGTGDTHFSIMRGTKANIIIRQGKEQNFKPELYIETPKGGNSNGLDSSLKNTFPALQDKFPGVELEKNKNVWHIIIPDKYRIGHEAHFGQVTEKFLQYLIDGKLPDWEVPNMLAKYYTTTSALELALQK
ncbi:oxidoreductase [candidate division KSB1 bacterium]|nr:oxidoreductase [candidate division KSB1 bacterium]